MSGECDICGEHTLDCQCDFRPQSIIRLEHKEKIWQNMQKSKIIEKIECKATLHGYDEKHIYSSDQKLKCLGYGEWVEEPDEILFEYQGMKCRINRILDIVEENKCFGGHLCGYVQIPKDHMLFEKHYDDIQIDVHGGLTYSNFYKDEYWIGFDCAHSFDICPSTEYLYKTDPYMIELRKRYPTSLVWKKEYRNVQYCIKECKKMIKQINSFSMKKDE